MFLQKNQKNKFSKKSKPYTHNGFELKKFQRCNQINVSHKIFT